MRYVIATSAPYALETVTYAHGGGVGVGGGLRAMLPHG